MWMFKNELKREKKQRKRQTHGINPAEQVYKINWFAANHIENEKIEIDREKKCDLNRNA